MSLGRHTSQSYQQEALMRGNKAREVQRGVLGLERGVKAHFSQVIRFTPSDPWEVFIKQISCCAYSVIHRRTVCKKGHWEKMKPGRIGDARWGWRRLNLLFSQDIRLVSTVFNAWWVCVHNLKLVDVHKASYIEELWTRRVSMII